MKFPMNNLNFPMNFIGKLHFQAFVVALWKFNTLFVQITCSTSDFNHTLSSQIRFISHHNKYFILASFLPQKNDTWVKWGMADIVDSLLKDVPGGIPKSDLLGVTLARIHVAGQWFLAVWNGLNQRRYCANSRGNQPYCCEISLISQLWQKMAHTPWDILNSAVAWKAQYFWCFCTFSKPSSISNAIIMPL